MPQRHVYQLPGTRCGKEFGSRSGTSPLPCVITLWLPGCRTTILAILTRYPLGEREETGQTPLSNSEATHIGVSEYAGRVKGKSSMDYWATGAVSVVVPTGSAVGAAFFFLGGRGILMSLRLCLEWNLSRSTSPAMPFTRPVRLYCHKVKRTSG